MKLEKYYGTNNRLMTELQKLATKDTAEYLYTLVNQPQLIPSETPETFKTLAKAKARLRNECFKEIEIDGYVAEFGVNDGYSLKQICKHFKNETVFGFDAFDGLPDGGKWPGNIIHNDQFRYDGMVPFNVPMNAALVKGWFSDTVPNFDFGHEYAKFLHIDCDVYSSTVDILTNIGHTITSGTVIVLDDYFNHPNWRQGEYRAWQEFVAAKKIRYEYLYVSGMATGIKIK